jgi:hypothetical protein
MSTTFPKIKVIVAGCLTATTLAGAISVPMASAADYGHGDLRVEMDRDGYRTRGESSTCRMLLRRIAIAKRQGEYRLAMRLERIYRRECRRYYRS